MTAEQLFSLTSTLALVGWLVLIAGGGRGLAGRGIWTIVGLLACIYVGLIGRFFFSAEGGFGTLAEVAQLFANPWLLLAGWIHYLAFDLFTGLWEVRDAHERGLSRWLVAPCLVLTFLFGPTGWLLYMVIRSIVPGKPADVATGG